MKIICFGIAKKITGQSEISWEGDITVDTLKKQLEQKYPELKKIKSYMIAANQSYASSDQLLLEGDEIAIIPPVSGG